MVTIEQEKRRKFFVLRQRSFAESFFSFFHYAIKPATELLAACTLLFVLAVQREIHMLFALPLKDYTDIQL